MADMVQCDTCGGYGKITDKEGDTVYQCDTCQGVGMLPKTLIKVSRPESPKPDDKKVQFARALHKGRTMRDGPRTVDSLAAMGQMLLHLCEQYDQMGQQLKVLAQAYSVLEADHRKLEKEHHYYRDALTWIEKNVRQADVGPNCEEIGAVALVARALSSVKPKETK